jgi:hypothetical protein
MISALNACWTEAVKSHLIMKGIFLKCLTIAGKGFDELIHDNTTIIMPERTDISSKALKVKAFAKLHFRFKNVINLPKRD